MTALATRQQAVRTAYVRIRNPQTGRQAPPSPPPSNAAPPQTPPIVQRGFVSLDQYLFAILVATKTGLDPRVVIAWVRAEEPADANPSERGHNWLNVGVGSPGGPKGAGIGWSGVRLAGTGNPGYKFANVNDAATETAWWINNMSNFAGIKQSAGKDPGTEFGAIVQSPWDGGHYGGSTRGLMTLYGQEGGGGGSSTLGDIGGWLSSAGSAATAGGALNPINDAIGIVKAGVSVSDFLGVLTQKTFWVRFAFVFVGLGFGIVGLIFLFESTSFGKGVTRGAITAAAA